MQLVPQMFMTLQELIDAMENISEFLMRQGLKTSICTPDVISGMHLEMSVSQLVCAVQTGDMTAVRLEII